MRIGEGGNNEWIDGVTRSATVSDAQVPGGVHKRIFIVPGGAKLRRGGSTKGDRDNTIGKVDGGLSFPALVQCAGQDVTIGQDKNFWWVLIDSPNGGGWVSAVLIDEGGDDQAIKDVPIAKTVFARPPS